jgi:hypothetical protein
MTEPSLFCLRMVTDIVIHAEEKANHSKVLKIPQYNGFTHCRVWFYYPSARAASHTPNDSVQWVYV